MHFRQISIALLQASQRPIMKAACQKALLLCVAPTITPLPLITSSTTQEGGQTQIPDIKACLSLRRLALTGQEGKLLQWPALSNQGIQEASRRFSSAVKRLQFQYAESTCSSAGVSIKAPVSFRCQENTCLCTKWNALCMRHCACFLHTVDTFMQA